MAFFWVVTSIRFVFKLISQQVSQQSWHSLWGQLFAAEEKAISDISEWLCLKCPSPAFLAEFPETCMGVSRKNARNHSIIKRDSAVSLIHSYLNLASYAEILLLFFLGDNFIFFSL